MPIDAHYTWGVLSTWVKISVNLILRKIFEAYFIYNHKPEINDRSEIKLLKRFLVNGDVIHQYMGTCMPCREFTN